MQSARIYTHAIIDRCWCLWNVLCMNSACVHMASVESLTLFGCARTHARTHARARSLALMHAECLHYAHLHCMRGPTYYHRQCVSTHLRQADTLFDKQTWRTASKQASKKSREGEEGNKIISSPKSIINQWRYGGPRHRLRYPRS